MKPALRVVGASLAVLWLTTAPAKAQDSAISTDGLELWVSADGPMKAANGQITEWTDKSPKGNNATHDAIGQTIPVLATANGQPTMKFSGGYTGFSFTQITTIRTVFVVLSKDSTSCLPTLPNYGTSAKFWLGGKAAPTFFHPEHGCSIYNSNLSEVSPNLVNGKTYINGNLIKDGRTTQFPFVLGLLSIVAAGNVTADTIARDRTFSDRSWQGNISELLIYSKALDDATRVSIENVLIKKYALGAASGDGGISDGSAGGNGGSSTGGNTGTGGAIGSGGTKGTGGTTGSGGTLATGGKSGSTSTGGMPGTGGTTSIVTSTGGTSSGGGTAAATGGTPGSGGTSSSTATGGAPGSGGTSAVPLTGGTSGGGGTSTSVTSSGGSSTSTTTGNGGAPTGGTSAGVGPGTTNSGSGCDTARGGERHLGGLLFVLLVMVSSPLLRIRRRASVPVRYKK